MHAKTSIKTRVPRRLVTSGCSINAALHLPATECGIRFDFPLTEIFKKTPCVAGLKPGGRYVAKDMFEVCGIPLLTKMLLDKSHLHCDCFAVAGLTFDDIDADIGALNVKLTGAELVEHETKWKARETNHTLSAQWKYAQQIGPAVDGAVTHPGGAHEKQCYADI